MLTLLMLSGVFWDPKGCNCEFYKNRKQADSNILCNPSGIIGLAKDRPAKRKMW